MWYTLHSWLRKTGKFWFPNRISRDSGTELVKTHEIGTFLGEAGRLGSLNMQCDARGLSLVIECLWVVQNILGVTVSLSRVHLSPALTKSCKISLCSDLCSNVCVCDLSCLDLTTAKKDLWEKLTQNLYKMQHILNICNCIISDIIVWINSAVGAKRWQHFVWTATAVWIKIASNM
jgi:hypothetical protein